MPEPAFILPADARRDFSRPRGLVYRGDLVELLEDAHEPLYCIGDVVSRYCAVTRKKHVVLVVDGKTRRMVEVRDVMYEGYTQIRISNPPGTVTLKSIQTICRLARNPGKWVINVDGEEDMLALPALACLQKEGTVVYGVPGIGATIINVTLPIGREAQARFLELKPSLI
ncbi:MAG: DUF359 domain-containing protein [Desulfurococcales archaeon]|nr:DUF359 domain-containing protein [Desulfurococcales archaeon]